jgi:predicted metal-dependent peptidase
MSRKLYEQTVMLLLQRSNNNYGGKRFYGHFLNSMRKHFDKHDVPTAGVNITNQINLYINTDWFKTLTEQQRVEVLQHECDHIIHYHQKRLKDLDESDFKLWNIACDASINEPLTSLHEFGVTVDKLRAQIPTLEKNQSSEYYYKKMQEYREENGGKCGKGEGELSEHGTVDDHGAWGKSEDLSGEAEGVEGAQGQIDEISKEIVKRAMKDAVEKSEGRGNVPMHILKAIEALNKANVNWKQQLKQFFARADKYSKKPTRKKLNRRYRHLNPGRRKDPMTHIAIGIDNSGSVSNSLFEQFFAEIKSAYNLGGIKFTIIQSDCAVNSVEEYSPKTEIKRTGEGGTAYMPAINKALELKADGMIYFGDGDIFGEQLTKPNFPFLWAMEDGRNAPATWGKVCHVKYNEKSRY